jgi:hypothetical protein
VATTAEIVVGMRANTQRFVADLERGRAAVKRTGDDFPLAQRKVENFAEELLGLAGVSGRVGDALIDVADAKIPAVSNAIKALQRAALPLLVIMTAIEIGQALGLWERLGDAIGLTSRKLEGAGGAYKQFAEESQKGAAAILAAESALAIARRQAAGDEAGEAQETLRARLATLEQERQARMQVINDTAKTDAARHLMVTNLEREQLAQRELAHLNYSSAVKKIRDDHEQKVIEQIEREKAEQIKAWVEETQALQGQLKARQEARDQFEAQIGTGAAALGVTSAGAGFRKLKELEENFRRELRDLDYLQREGRIGSGDAEVSRENARAAFIAEAEKIREKYGQVPAVMDAVRRSIDSVQFRGFNQEVASASQWVNTHIATLDELKGREEQLHRRWTVELPAAVNVAAQEVRKLTEEFVLLKAWIDAALQSSNALATAGSSQ